MQLITYELLDQEPFLKKYNIQADALEITGSKWEDLVAIAGKHHQESRGLETTAREIAERLREVPEVQSLKFRVKDVEHLIEKIIRKKLKDPERVLTIDTYKDEFTDLIGVRALHLFKEDWVAIHEYIMDNWYLKPEIKPTANVRAGDDPDVLELFKTKGCQIDTRTSNYKSVHYIVQSQATKATAFTEIQVRTIFEEGWSEIDHKLRYPHDTDNPVLNQLSAILNRLSGSADEIGTYMIFLKQYLQSQKHEYQLVAQERDVSRAETETTKAELQDTIAKLDINASEKDKLRKQVDDALDENLRLTYEPSIQVGNFTIASNPAPIQVKLDTTNLGIGIRNSAASDLLMTGLPEFPLA